MVEEEIKRISILGVQDWVYYVRQKTVPQEGDK